MHVRLITRDNLFSTPLSEKKPWQENYLSMYSSQWHGFVKDPALMLVPIDDHLVHRGDGVFDVMRCISGKIYQMEAHLNRLETSAKAISLSLPSDYKHIRDIIKTLVLVGRERDCLVRVILSRGPGSFSTNPYDCPSGQIYANVVRYSRLPDEYYQNGVSIVTSEIPVKRSPFATIKSCNYLPNVLMKMEAINAGCQYAIALDEHGFLAEGSTENVGVVSKDNMLKFPGFEKTLAGITVKRIFELAQTLVKEQIIQDVQFANIPLEEAYQASEIMLFGTSVNILPAVSFDGRDIGSGLPGPVYFRLSHLLQADMLENQDLLTEINWREI